MIENWLKIDWKLIVWKSLRIKCKNDGVSTKSGFKAWKIESLNGWMNEWNEMG